MHKLISELQRLYFLDMQPGVSVLNRQADDSVAGDALLLATQTLNVLAPAMLAQQLSGECSVSIPLLDAQQMLRTMVVSFEHVSDWDAVARLFQGVQSDLDLPAPAISVSGHQGYGIWFSLARPLPLPQARRFLDALRANYLADMSGVNLAFHPAASDQPVNLVPALQASNGKWSAFIDPSMGSMFIEEAGLDMAPNMDRQAEMLAGLRSIKEDEFAHALTVLQALEEEQAKAKANAQAASENAAARPVDRPATVRSTSNVGNDFSDPRSFLLAVMNDPAASTKQRIRAAKALLPYFTSAGPA
jgi:hypothetical protein